MLPRIAVTIGDPAGIGPEVVLKELADPATAGLARWTVVGDTSVLRDAESRYSLTLPKRAEWLGLDRLASANVQLGVSSAACGRAAVEYVRRATEAVPCRQGGCNRHRPGEQRSCHPQRTEVLRSYRIHCRALRGEGFSNAPGERSHACCSRLHPPSSEPSLRT